MDEPADKKTISYRRGKKRVYKKNGWKARVQEINQILSFVEEMK